MPRKPDVRRGLLKVLPRTGVDERSPRHYRPADIADHHLIVFGDPQNNQIWPVRYRIMPLR
jgi:hypothetical protein